METARRNVMIQTEESNKKNSVVIVDASPLFREALAKLLHDDSDFGNVAETGDKQLGMFYIDRLQPDLVIVDMHMKKGAAIELLRYAGEVDRDLNCLTSREKDVLKCLSIGMSNQQTGEYLSIQLGTVKVHVKHILKKMGFASRTQAALWARDRGVTI